MQVALESMHHLEEVINAEDIREVYCGNPATSEDLITVKMKDVDWGERNKSKEYLEKRYRFYDKRTEVLNWDNSEESNIEESEIDFFDVILNPET